MSQLRNKLQKVVNSKDLHMRTRASHLNDLRGLSRRLRALVLADEDPA